MRLPTLVPLELRRFTGTPKFEVHGETWRTFNDSAAWPENHRYVGTPSQAIDDAWNELIGCRYISLSEEEAADTWGARHANYRDEGLGGYTAGLDVFHTLHCVNALRKSLYPDFYPETRLHGTVHLEHCIDVLRQEVQCYGSTTLIPSQYFPAIEQNYIDSDQQHVCRSFTTLREWTNRRRIHGDLYVKRNTSGIDETTLQRAIKYNLDSNGELCS
ncbi:unnamed protein product [Zymoseptoria tritici ST99CH_3D7]|uniref:Tat pathway signal sequence n=1 Tax=Zymoseptoria tritici (strain ST99CH_3D7) TaxID=1276538 RepID=A0A1X7RIX8_ZYMT9|nr:unnamed protein product [Zymoseptoria tritici ST99CH_3D7]